MPRRLQAERGGEQGFDLDTHHGQQLGQEPAIEPPIVMFVDLSISTGNGIEPGYLRAEKPWQRDDTPLR